MSDIIEYMHWRGDLTFEQCPFCEVDNLVLAYMSYVNLDGIAPAPQMGAVTVKEASTLFFELYTPEYLKEDRSFIRRAPYGLEAMASSERFKNAKIQNYVNQIEPEKEL